MAMEWLHLLHILKWLSNEPHITNHLVCGNSTLRIKQIQEHRFSQLPTWELWVSSFSYFWVPFTAFGVQSSRDVYWCRLWWKWWCWWRLTSQHFSDARHCADFSQFTLTMILLEKVTISISSFYSVIFPRACNLPIAGPRMDPGRSCSRFLISSNTPACFFLEKLLSIYCSKTSIYIVAISEVGEVLESYKWLFTKHLAELDMAMLGATWFKMMSPEMKFLKWSDFIAIVL